MEERDIFKFLTDFKKEIKDDISEIRKDIKENNEKTENKINELYKKHYECPINSYNDKFQNVNLKIDKLEKLTEKLNFILKYPIFIGLGGFGIIFYFLFKFIF